MGVLAEMALEGFGSNERSDRQILFNLELNNRCSYSVACGNNCYLNVMAKGSPAESLTEEQIFEAANEVISQGEEVRHLAIVGKEPLESPELLLRILRRYHAASERIRPWKIGVITAAARRLSELAEDFISLPLDWLAVSVDPSNLLRPNSNSRSLLQNALQLRKRGGVSRVGVNTCFDDSSWESALDIGKQVLSQGIDQWSIASHVMPRNGFMTSTTGRETLRRLVDSLVRDFAEFDSCIMLELDYSKLPTIFGNHPALKDHARHWRIEIPLSENVRVITPNPLPGFFLRFRHDGQLMSKDDFRKVGLRKGSCGHYEPGKIVRNFSNFTSAIRSKNETFSVS